MRLIDRSAVALALPLILAGSLLVAQTSASPVRTVTAVDSAETFGFAEPSSGRFVVYASADGIRVLNRRTGKLTTTIDRTTANLQQSYFGQLFANVLVNAAQASRAGGRVSVSVDANGRPEITVTIRDDGAGMTAEVLARAGEPLFSTKAEETRPGARDRATDRGGAWRHRLDRELQRNRDDSDDSTPARELAASGLGALS